MRVLYVDITSPIGHVNYNYKIIKLMSQISNVDIALREGYLSDITETVSINKRYDIPNDFFPEIIAQKKKKHGYAYKLEYRYKLFQAMKWVNTIAKKQNYDIVFFSSIEIVSFCLSTLFVKQRYVFLDHAIAEIHKSPVKRFFWKHLNNCLEACVMEDYIHDYLVNNVKIKNKIWILKHPLPQIYFNINKIGVKQNDGRKFIFAPSGSNDEEFISYLIENVNLISNNFKISIKSKSKSFCSSNLKVFNTRLTNEDYDNLMKQCDFVLLPYDRNYNYRVSGVFFEAVMYGKRSILNTNNTLEYYANKYDEVILKFKGYSGFLDILNSINNRWDVKQLESIKEEYSDSSLLSQLKLILNSKDV